MFKPGSAWRGLRAMKWKHGKVNYAIKWLPHSWWFHLWTPRWHEGRGFYLSVGLWAVAIYRGY